MITATGIHKAKQLVASALTAHNFSLAKKDPAFIGSAVGVSDIKLEEQVMLEEERHLPRRFAELTYAGWTCYVSDDAKMINQLKQGLLKQDMQVCYEGISDCLYYIMAVQKK